MRQSTREQEFTENVRRAVEQMKARREAARRFEELSQQDPEAAAQVALTSAKEERERIQRNLKERFGFVVRREGRDFHCNFIELERAPGTLEQAAQWVDSVVSLVGWQLALEAMNHTWAFFPEMDRAQKVCDAFVDIMEQVPAAYNFFAREDFDPNIRQYAAAVVAAWTRSYLKSYGKTQAAFNDKNWAQRLASAALQAWEELGEKSPMKRSTRYRDTLPKTRDGRRQRAKGPRSYINLVDAILTDQTDRPSNSPELELAQFADRKALLKRGRDAGLTPKEMELYKFLIQNPDAKNHEAADKLGMSLSQVGVLKHRIKKTLNAS